MSATPTKDGIGSVSLIFACGTALFSDGYANGIIGSVNTILVRIYGETALNNPKHNYSRTLTSLAFVGTVLGMLTFGYLSDKVGRKFGMLSAAGIVAVFSFLSACSSGAHGSFDGLLAMLSACRFLLGIGVGAEYPCGSVSASEQSEESAIKKNAQHRWFALATNAMIDFGFVIAAFVPLVLYWIFGPNHLRAVWRGSLGLGVIPAVAVFLWRFKMDEPDRYKTDSMKRAKIPYCLIIRRYGGRFAAISATWFIYDFILYPFGIYSSTVVDNITGRTDALTVIFGWNVIINLFFMPGAIGGAFILDYLGPKNTMILGLLAQAVIGFIMSGLYQQLTKHIAAFAVMYGIFLSLGEVGPGNCLGLLAAKSSPTAVRGQFYGLAAAVGKIGAFVGIWAFPPMIDAFGGSETLRGNTGPFWLGSALAVLSALITYFFVVPLTHDGMAEEDAKVGHFLYQFISLTQVTLRALSALIMQFREYLEMNGYDTSQMGLTEPEPIFMEK